VHPPCGIVVPQCTIGVPFGMAPNGLPLRKGFRVTVTIVPAGKLAGSTPCCAIRAAGPVSTPHSAGLPAASTTAVPSASSSSKIIWA
jgi:hypothetical protein